jgi:hypothetical protein
MHPTGTRTGTYSLVGLYQHAVRKFLGARARLQQMVALLTRVAGLLEGDRWKAAAGAQAPAGVPELRSAGEQRLGIAELPSGRDLVAALTEWRDAWETLGKAWQALPAESQVRLKEPKELY